MQKLKRVACIGECMLELSEHGPGTFKLGYAGDTFNTAWYLRARLSADWQVDYVTAIGDDIYSDQMLSFCEANGLGTDHIKRISNRRPGLYIIRQSEGDRHFTYWRGQSAAKQLADDEAFLNKALAGVELVYFSGITLAILDVAARQRLLTAVKKAKDNGAQIAFDPNERPALWESIDVMKSTLEQAASLARFAFPTFPDERTFFGDQSPQAVATRYRALGAHEIVVKNGAEAALVKAEVQQFEISPKPGVKSVDPTGAGDSFNGAYLAARLQQSAPEQAARLAHDVAGIVIGHPGALVPMALVKP
jgi:2-dehydro-3-deoxygluconokinase